ncbi:hypothetical protein ISP15_13420 [Dyella jejuensis]|uniref:Cellulose biosynthesis protein BcsS n=1 Tax=Dyella jejuensis TaxID=1432009 RepID=A0ABW8JJQ2_9GAMM
MKRRIAPIVALGCAVTCAHAEDGRGALAGNLTAASQYVSRGFQQSWGRPALQGGVEYGAPNGWYAGSWLSTISPYAIEGGRVEWDIYAGKRGKFGALNYQVALYDYRYPGARVTATNTRYGYSELVAGMTWCEWSLSYSLTVSRDYFGDNSQTLGIGANSHSRGSGYIDLARNVDLGHGYSLALHYGRQRVNHFSSYSWQDASATLSRRLGGFDVALAYARGWNKAGVYRHVTTGEPDRQGRLHFSNPAAGTWWASIGHEFSF